MRRRLKPPRQAIAGAYFFLRVSDRIFTIVKILSTFQTIYPRAEAAEAFDDFLGAAGK